MENNEKKLIYASKDKPWMKFYKDYSETKSPNTNLTEYLKNKKEVKKNKPT